MSKASIEFKKTKIGLFPKDWKVNKLIKLLDDKKELIVGGPFGSNLMVKDYRESGIPIIRLQNIQYFRFINQDIKYITTQKAEELKYHSFQKGDIVLAKLGDPVGKTCIVPDYLERGIVTADVVRIRSLNNEISDQYLMYMLNSYIVWKQLTRDVIGSTRPRVNLGHVRNLLIPLPSLIEQQKIAFVLSNIDEAIDQTNIIINQLQSLKKGLMQRLFTEGIGHTEFKETKVGKIPRDWNWSHLIKISQFSQGFQVPIKFQIKEKKERYIRFLRIVDYTQTENDKRYIEIPNEKYIVDEKDIVIVRYGASAGFIGTGKYGVIANNLFKIEPDTNILKKKFLYHYLNQENVNKFFTRIRESSAMPAISHTTVGQLRIKIPPIEEQNSIILILDNVDKQIQIEQNYYEILKEIKKGLMQDLLTGKKRVKIN